MRLTVKNCVLIIFQLTYQKQSVVSMSVSGSMLSPYEMSFLIFHTQGTDPLSCNWGIRDLQMCRISHRLCTHERTRMHFVCSSKSAWCALSTDCPATAAASTAATQNQPPAATNPGEASLCLHGHPYDVRACLCMCPLCVGFVWACEYVCARVGITHNSNFVIVIVAAFLCSAISIWGLNQRWLIMVTPPPLTYTHTKPV